jgi:DNA modification methylase
MLDLRNGDCLEILKDIPSKTIDLVFADLPYGQTNCKWDCKIDLELLWKELLRVAKSDHTPFFFTVTTKFGYELIKSNEKMFKYDLVWAKSNPCGFLQAKKQPMRKHELLYVFYKKQPAYDISSHKHKFKKEEPPPPVITETESYKGKKTYGKYKNMGPNTGNLGYDPPLPTSIIKEEQYNMKTLYGDVKLPDCYTTKNNKVPSYDPPLPTSVIKEECIPTRQVKEGSTYGNIKLQENREAVYDPPLPTSVIKEDNCYNKGGKDHYEDYKTKLGYGNRKNGESAYDPPLPTSVIKEEEDKVKYSLTPIEGTYGEINRPYYKCKNGENNTYDPPLPTSIIKEEVVNEKDADCYNFTNRVNNGKLNKPYTSQERKESVYDPPLPTSVIKEEVVNEKDADYCYGKFDSPYTSQERKEAVYDPPLPTSVIKEEEPKKEDKYNMDNYLVKDCGDKKGGTYGRENKPHRSLSYPQKNGESAYDPPLPTSVLEIKSVRLKQHSTSKPPDLMKWILKYYSKEGDTILDPTMGSNPMGLACKEMNRKFIGIEMDETIYNFACDRVK